MEEETKGPMIPVISYETVPSENGYYYGVHGVLHFHKEYGVDRKEDREEVYPYPDED